MVAKAGVVVLLAAVAVSGKALDGYTFADYVSDYGRSYEAREYVLRKAAFEANMGAILRENVKAATHTFGVNEYTDMTPEEFVARKTGLSRAERFANHHRFDGGKVLSGEAPPPSRDWRAANPAVLTPVKNQRGCGSCWAFASTETIESHGAISTGKLHVLSPQQLVDCAKNPNDCGGTGGCGGSIQALAFNYTIQNGGLTNATAYPYTAKDGTCMDKTVKPVVGITGQVDLRTNDAESLLRAVGTVGPVAVSVAASKWQLYSGGVYDAADCGTDVNHVVQLVGYGHDTPSGKDYWIVRNSWGPTWGEGGYIRVVRYPTGAAPCAIDYKPKDGFICNGGPANITVCGMCGILSGSAYPTGAFNA